MKGLELGLSASDRLSLSGIQIGGEASITQTPISGVFTIGLLGSWQKLLCWGNSSLKVHNLLIPQGVILETIAMYEDYHFDCGGESWPI